MATDQIDGLAAVRCAAQGADGVKAGEPGYWKVWGARACDARIGDVIVTLNDDDSLRFDEVAYCEDKATHTLFFTPSWNSFVIGNYYKKLVLLRPGTRYTLADSV
jgi:hypothetical protein